MESTQVFQSFFRNVIEALNERLRMRSEAFLYTLTYAQIQAGNHPRPKRYVVTDASASTVTIQKNFRSAIVLENLGFYGATDELAVRITGPGRVSQTVFSNDGMEDIVLTILQLDSI